MRPIVDLVRRHKLFFLLVTLAALALRLFFVFHFRLIAGDTFVYGDIAKNWLTHGIYGLSDGMVRPTLIRLPGYPGFLAVMFSLFGHEHYGAVTIVQAFIDTNTCLVIAALALELMNERAAKAAYLLAALCPFTANYSATPLAETLAIFCTAHSLYYGIRGLKALDASESGIWRWLACGLWASASIYMRPDNGLVLVAFGLALLFYLFRTENKKQPLIAGVVLAAAGLLPLVPWAVRNWKVFHVFQPLASRYANDPGEFLPSGFNHWVRTWSVDFVSVDEVYWRVSGQTLDVDNLPERAFDSRQEYDQTDELISDYNFQLSVDEDLDQRFERLANERVVHNPFRYYMWLPFLRTADMWLRPRTELLPIGPRWWEFQEPKESTWALFLAGLNLFFLVAAFRGWKRWQLGTYGMVLIGFVLLRSAFLSSLENPEPRYVLECFPVVLALAAGAFAKTD